MRTRSQAGGASSSEYTKAEIENIDEAFAPGPPIPGTGGRSIAIGVDPAGEASEVTALTVHWGREQFQPLQYHGLEVGPFDATVVVRKGETIGQAALRAHRELAAVARQAFEEKLRDYIGRIDEIQAAIERSRSR